MNEYSIKSYETGFEEDQVRLGLEVIKDWVWPYQYNLEFLKNLYSSTDFDPNTALFCFKDKRMVGFTLARIGVQAGVVGPGVKKRAKLGANLDLPRVLPNNEKAENLLMGRIIEKLKMKKVPFIQTRASTMHTNSIELVRKWGFNEVKDYPLGYKLYYYYDLKKENIKENKEDVERFEFDRDIEYCAISVSNFFKRTLEEAKKDIEEINNSEDLVSHLVIRKKGMLEGYCYALPNNLNKDIIATFHLEASKEKYLKQLLVQVIDDCLKKGSKYLLIDVIGGLLKFEKVFLNLGFDEVATWGIYEKDLS
ncbi:MAG: hypothetical protein HeimAB125_22720 [Candidatus Heimdallarchaeota archaeon AB_125]|nr:MAG: hypothetical protein HeimAB125_22720 [Candidatus Heimdallarchaeota archaeon AB_125]